VTAAGHAGRPQLVALASELCPAPVAALRAAGRPIVGYGCLATPRELIDAAGFHPYRIRALGRAQRDLADAHLSRFNCSFCRSCLQLGLDGSLDFLDALIETNGCDHLRGMFENWHAQRPGLFFHYLRVPHLAHDDALDAFVDELSDLRRALGELRGHPIADEELRAARERRRAISARVSALAAGRAAEPPTLSGAEALALALLDSTLPLADLEALLRELEAVPPSGAHGSRSVRSARGPRARLLLGGGATDELALVSEIEALGARIVGDLLCFGGRAVTPPPPPADDPDPLRAIARELLAGLHCPRMFDGYARRLRATSDAIHAARADGVLLVHNQLCDLHGVENARLRLDLEARGVPVLVLEKEYGSSADLGRIRTRVQAFVERVEQRGAGGPP
jgi:benzoyl-CoA reductase/2-hydroxyglutaryl-CoA dehydratase subunit BcrC/BadD/HgdB